ncbi:MAG: pantetheine-phosphate adenylyltransferase [Candidatus Comchoanobacterales bacterium]
MGKTAIFPGTFDPLTLGHEQIIGRLLRLFDSVIVVVANNTGKKAFMKPEDRVSAIQTALSAHQRVQVMQFSGLLVDFVSTIKDAVVVRGVRSVNDYLYEHDRAMMNQAMMQGFETLFLPAAPKYSSLSSTLVREILWLKGDASQFLSKSMHEFIKEYYGA